VDFSERSAVALSDTLGSFTFVDSRGAADWPISVWYYRPTVLRRTPRRIRHARRLEDWRDGA
jgi:hypothetical protein